MAVTRRALFRPLWSKMAEFARQQGHPSLPQAVLGVWAVLLGASTPTDNPPCVLRAAVAMEVEVAMAVAHARPYAMRREQHVLVSVRLLPGLGTWYVQLAAQSHRVCAFRNAE